MNDLTLPKELSECHLSLQEIGAIFVLYSLNKIDIDAQSYWATNDLMIETGQSLTERGILKFSKNDDSENIMEIDLTGVVSMKKEFWEFYDYDCDGNDIWYHDSNLGDITSRFRYELHPKLFENQITWSLKHSEFELIEEYLIIYSLEEGEEIVRELLKTEFDQIKKEDLNKSNE